MHRRPNVVTQDHCKANGREPDHFHQQQKRRICDKRLDGCERRYSASAIDAPQPIAGRAPVSARVGRYRQDRALCGPVLAVVAAKGLFTDV
jgi:hypothetical protein